MRSKLGKVNISWEIVALVFKPHVVIMQTCSVLHCKIRHKPLNKRGDTKTWAGTTVLSLWIYSAAIELLMLKQKFGQI